MLTIEKSQCSGCGACVNVCPTRAIRMEYDGEGFAYCVIDPAKCIDCHQCEKHCPQLNLKKPRAAIDPQTWAVQVKDPAARLRSSSGGVFMALAQAVISRGGTVFGAALTESFELQHTEASTVEALAGLSGSKYLQSEIGLTYTAVRTRLEEGRLVLFSGTPCQAAGLKAYLGREYENLLCTDFICHGVPSPVYWKKYVQYRAECAGSRPVAVSFRDKSKGWRSFAMRFQFEDGSEYCMPHEKDPYMRLFLHDLNLRPSCYQCSFRTKNRISDLTIADFWGVRHFCPELDDDTGVSLVILHSEAGRRIFEEIREQLTAREVPFQAVLKGNVSMIQSSPCPKNRQACLETAGELTPPQAAERFTRPTLKQRAVAAVKKAVRPIISKIR